MVNAPGKEKLTCSKARKVVLQVLRNREKAKNYIRIFNAFKYLVEIYGY